MKDAVFGSDLTYADLIENFFAWEHQTIVGTETVDRVPCQILESKPGKGDRSIYGRVRSWIDLKRLVPLRVEKYFESGQLARRIDTTRVAEGRHRSPGSRQPDGAAPGTGFCHRTRRLEQPARRVATPTATSRPRRFARSRSQAPNQNSRSWCNILIRLSSRCLSQSSFKNAKPQAHGCGRRIIFQ